MLRVLGARPGRALQAVTSRAAHTAAKDQPAGSPGVAVCTVLSHSRAGLDTFAAAMAALGAECAPATPDAATAMPVSALQAAMKDGSLLQVVHIDGLDKYLVNKRPGGRPARLLSVALSQEFNNNARAHAWEWLSLLPSAATHGSMFHSITSPFEWNRFASGVGAEPAAQLCGVPAGSRSGTACRRRSGPGLKEVVLGESTPEALAATEAALRSGGAARAKRALSVWEFPGPEAAAVRVLPSRWSAVVLSVESLDDASTSLGAVGGVTTTLHGLRGGAPMRGRGSKGTPPHGQMIVTIDALPGLDLRLTELTELAPFWAESDAASNEHVDEALNPQEGSHLQRASLGCASVVGKQMGAGLRGRFRFLRDL